MSNVTVTTAATLTDRITATLLADEEFVSDVAATIIFGTNHVSRAEERLGRAVPLVVSRVVEALGDLEPQADLASLRTMAEAATPGPWGDPQTAHIGDFGWSVLGCPAGETADSEQGRADAAYIAAANPAVVLDLIDRLTAVPPAK